MRAISSLFALLAATSALRLRPRLQDEINQATTSRDMVAKLRKRGQTRQQVKLLLGTPTTESVFHTRTAGTTPYSLERRGWDRHLAQADRGVRRRKIEELDGRPICRRRRWWTRDPALRHSRKDKKAGRPPGWWSRIADWWRK